MILRIPPPLIFPSCALESIQHLYTRIFLAKYPRQTKAKLTKKSAKSFQPFRRRKVTIYKHCIDNYYMY